MGLDSNINLAFQIKINSTQDSSKSQIIKSTEIRQTSPSRVDEQRMMISSTDKEDPNSEFSKRCKENKFYQQILLKLSKFQLSYGLYDAAAANDPIFKELIKKNDSKAVQLEKGLSITESYKHDFLRYPEITVLINDTKRGNVESIYFNSKAYGETTTLSAESPRTKDLTQFMSRIQSLGENFSQNFAKLHGQAAFAGLSKIYFSLLEGCVIDFKIDALNIEIDKSTLDCKSMIRVSIKVKNPDNSNDQFVIKGTLERLFPGDLMKKLNTQDDIDAVGFFKGGYIKFDQVSISVPRFALKPT